MKWISSLVVLTGLFWISSVSCLAQPAAVKGSLDELIEWKDPWSLTQEKFIAVAEAIPHKQSERAYNTRTSGTKVIFTIGEGIPPYPADRKLSLFEGRVPVAGINAVFEGDKLTSLIFHLGTFRNGPDRKPAKPADIALFKVELGKRIGDTAPSHHKTPLIEGTRPVPTDIWAGPNYQVRAAETDFGASYQMKTFLVIQVNIVPK